MVDEDQNRLSDEELNALVSNHEEADFTAAVLDPTEIEQKSVRPHNWLRKIPLSVLIWRQ